MTPRSSCCGRLNPFLGDEADAGKAQIRAIRNREFWTLVFSTGKISYTEWKGMCLSEYMEAREAYLNYMDSLKNSQGV